MRSFEWFACIFVAFCFIEAIQGISGDNSDDIEGYYWRAFRGKVPKDALLGGSDEFGDPTYIGLAVHQGILIPGYINAKQQQMYYEWGQLGRISKRGFKILCTQHPEQFEWIRTNNETITNLFNETFVYGGFENDYTIYIGRTNVDNQYVIGKVLVIDGKCYGLNTSCNGRFVSTIEFEILNYNPDIPYESEIKKSLSERNLHHTNFAMRAVPGFIYVFIVTVLMGFR